MTLSVGMSLLMTWIYQNTDRSILSGTLLHFTSNFSAQLIAPSSDRLEILRVLLILEVGIAGIVWGSRKTKPGAQQSIPAV
jgi:hypothetical protein